MNIEHKPKAAKYLIANNNKKCNKNKERKKKQLQFYELTNHHSVRLALCQRELCKWMEDFLNANKLWQAEPMDRFVVAFKSPSRLRVKIDFRSASLQLKYGHEIGISSARSPIECRVCAITHTHTCQKNSLTFKQINCPRWPSSIHQEYRAMPNAYKYATIYGIKKYKFEESRLFSTTNW